MISEKKDLLDHSLADMKRLQYLRDQAGRANHMLDLNISVMESMVIRCEEFQELFDVTREFSYRSFRNDIHNFISEHTFCRKNVASLQVRAANLSHQVIRLSRNLPQCAFLVLLRKYVLIKITS